MNNISARGFAVTAVLFYFGNSYILGSNADMGRDDWLCMLTAAVIELPLVLLLSVLAKNHPGKNLFDIIKEHTNKAVFYIIASVYALYGVFLLSMSLSCFSRYVCTSILLETPKAVMAFMLAACAYLFILKDSVSLARASASLFIVVTLVVIVTYAVSVPHLVLSEILPVARDSIWQGVYKCLAFPFAEPVILFSMMPDVQSPTKKKYWLVPYIFAGLILVLNVMRNTMVLGSALSGITTFPTAKTDSVVGYMSFQQRLEVLTTMIPAAAGLVEAALAALFTCQALSAVFGTKKNAVTGAFVCAAGAFLSLVLYTSGGSLDTRAMIWPAASVPLQLAPILFGGLHGKGSKRRKAKIFLRSLKKTME